MQRFAQTWALGSSQGCAHYAQGLAGQGERAVYIPQALFAQLGCSARLIRVCQHHTAPANSLPSAHCPTAASCYPHPSPHSLGLLLLLLLSVVHHHLHPRLCVLLELHPLVAHLCSGHSAAGTARAGPTGTAGQRPGLRELACPSWGFSSEARRHSNRHCRAPSTAALRSRLCC